MNIAEMGWKRSKVPKTFELKKGGVFSEDMKHVKNVYIYLEEMLRMLGI